MIKTILAEGFAVFKPTLLLVALPHLLCPHRMGCSPAHSCTKAENWEWGFSASSFPFLPPVPPPSSAPPPPSSPGMSVVFGPHVVALRGQVMFVGEAGVRPAQAPLGSRRARPESRSTSFRSLSISARSFSKALRSAWERGATERGRSSWSWGARGEDRKTWWRDGAG